MRHPFVYEIHEVDKEFVMNTHYYLGWFNHCFSDKLAKLLKEDIVDHTSIVLISADLTYRYGDEIGKTELSWLNQADIMFDEYHIIDYKTEKEDAQNLIRNAPVIFLLGGNVLEQNEFLVNYELKELIKESNSIVLGASAGSINMSAKWQYSDSKDDEVILYEGIGFDDFSVLSHYDLENNFDSIQSDLFQLLNEMNVYASNKDCAMRIKNGQIDIIGDVYLITKSNIQKLDETL